jgi:hypothetical protein
MGCIAGVDVSEKKKIVLPILGMELECLAYVKTVFSEYCFSVGFVYWCLWLNRTHCMKSFYGHDIYFVKFVRMLSCMSLFCIYAICLMNLSCRQITFV